MQDSVDQHGTLPTALLPILRDVQVQDGSLSAGALGAAADALALSDAHVRGVADFYSMFSTTARPRNVIRICDGPACMLNGAASIRHSAEALTQNNPEWCVQRTSCLGLCDRAPAALANAEPCGPLVADRIQHGLEAWRGTEPSYDARQLAEVRIALAGRDPGDADDLCSSSSNQAYSALRAALEGHPDNVLTVVEESGLQGCGGAGFPTGTKWRRVAQAHPPKYIICNADESEPGAFKDRVLMETSPHLVLEGMALAGFAVGSSEGIVYIRGEYERAAKKLEAAIDEAVAGGILGKTIRGTEFSFQVHVHRGAGAYICGEETALLESAEGRRGEPRLRPPYPTSHGYLGRPTVVNNVETLCKIPAIVRKGADWFRRFGTPNCPGTKLYTLSGHARRPGIYEVPFGRTLREIIDGLGLGMRTGSRFKMALTGGAAGTIVPEKLLDVPLDFTSHAAHGVAVGSGVVIVVDQSVSAVELLEWILHFFRVESCGKCTPCRQGTVVAHDIVRRIAAGKGQPDDVVRLDRLAKMLATTSLCGLGQSIAWPIQSALQHFADDFAQLGAG